MKNTKSLARISLALICLSATHPWAQTTTTYGYDARNRLNSMSQTGQTTTYSYDDAGNRTQINTSCDGTFNMTATYSSGQPLNLRNLANGLGYDGSVLPTLTVTVTTSITGAPGGNVAIDTGTWPTSGACLNLIINSGVTIRGGGGNGGNGGRGSVLVGATAGADGGGGGHALYLQSALSITNNGILQGGSGGGGGGGGYKQLGGENQLMGGGGGGGGWPNGIGGAAGAGPDGNGMAGGNGSTSQGGIGGAGGDANAGGAGGGAIAKMGLNGQTDSAVGGSGGSPGWGIKTNGYLLGYSGSGSNSGTGK